MRHAICTFSSEQEKKTYVHSVEEAFERALDQAVAQLLSHETARILTLSGPTCAGKTTMAKKLVAELAERGKRLHVISIDDFYYNRQRLVEDARNRGVPLDFDSPLTLDLEMFAKATEKILAGQEVELPMYDFKEGCRSGFRTLTAGERDIFMFEGIQAVYPEVTGLLRGVPYRSVYVSVQESLEVGGQTFLPNDIRFFRRLVRDFRFRDAQPAFTFYLWDSVRQNEESNIFPYVADCDVTVNTVMDYEIGMLKPSLASLLSRLPEGDPHKETAQRMEAAIEGVEEISQTYLPKHSMYHEFLG